MVLNSSGSQVDDGSDKQSMYSSVFTVMLLEYSYECLHDIEDCIHIYCTATVQQNHITHEASNI